MIFCNLTGYEIEEEKSLNNFITIEPSKIKLTDSFIINYYPTTEKQMRFYEMLTAVVKKEIKEFKAPKMDPSFLNLNEERVVFIENKKPALGKPVKDWHRLAYNVCPEKNSRIGSLPERIIFNGFLIKKLVEDYSRSKEEAWQMVCDQSKLLGNYNDSEKSNGCFEETGSREIAGFFDWGNTSKFVMNGNSAILTGGNCKVDSDMYPITYQEKIRDLNFPMYSAVGWVVMDN